MSTKKNLAGRAAVCAAALALLLGTGGQSLAGERADTVYVNGVIYTMTESMEEAKDPAKAKTVEVVAVKDGKIVFAGSRAEAERDGRLQADRVVDLRGKTLLPGLVDGHGHFPRQGGYDLYRVNLNSYPLGAMRSIADYKTALSERCRSAGEGDWVQGWGYDDTLVEEMRHPTRQDLDEACPNNPVYVLHVSGHMGVANSAALAKASPEDLKIVGVDAASGKLTESRAMQVVTRKIPADGPNAGQRALDRANEVYAAAGVTTADCSNILMLSQLPRLQRGIVDGALTLRVVLHPLAYYPTTLDSGQTVDSAGWVNRAALGWRTDTTSLTAPATDEKSLPFADGSKAVRSGGDITRLSLPAYVAEAKDGGLTAAPRDLTTPPAELKEDERLFLGAWKITLDGSPQGYTAWLKEPGFYHWGPYKAEDSFNKAGYFNGAVGTDNTPVPLLETLISLYHGAGQSTEVHTNGSAAAERWVTALEKAVVRHPEIADTRDTSIHGQMMELQHIQRLTGNYQNLPGTADMYTELTGAFSGGKLSPEAVGAADVEQLSALMRAQHFFNSYFVSHTYFWGDRHYGIFMGPGRARNMSPLGWSLAYGQPYSFHNDTYITPISPLRSVQSAVTRTSAQSVIYKGGTPINGEGRDLNAQVLFPARDPKETGDAAARPFWNYDHRANALQSLHGVTAMPAYQNKVDGRVGSIRPGLLADFTILDADPIAVAATDPQSLASIRVAATIVNDKPVYGFLPDARSFAGAPKASYAQPSEETVVLTTAAEEDLAPHQGTTDKRLGAWTFAARVEGGDTAVFRMPFLGNGGQVKELRLSHEHGAYAYAPDRTMTDGTFWIASLDAPLVPLKGDETLRMDGMYLAFFTVRDGSPADLDVKEGSIGQKVSLTTTGAWPRNGLPPQGATARR